jgi:hypothetical protein
LQIPPNSLLVLFTSWTVCTWCNNHLLASLLTPLSGAIQLIWAFILSSVQLSSIFQPFHLGFMHLSVILLQKQKQTTMYWNWQTVWLLWQNTHFERDQALTNSISLPSHSSLFLLFLPAETWSTKEKYKVYFTRLHLQIQYVFVH